jgi:urease accessory protein
MPAAIITIMTTTMMMMSMRTDTPPPLAGLSREADRGRGEGEPLYQPPYQSPSALLRLLAWLSPAFPTGGFAYSHGLEWAVESGDIRDGESLRAWLADVLVHGTGRSDAILLWHAACPDADLPVLAELAAATGLARERRAESLNQGAAFGRAAAAWGCPALPDPVPYPIAVGALVGAHCIESEAAVAAYLQAFSVNLISAAVRLVPLGQSTGLAVLAALEPVILGVVASTRDATLDDLGGAAFRSDLAAMLHETQYTRLFRS